MLESVFDNLEFETSSSDKNYGKLTVKGLDAGEYMLMMREAKANIYVKVFKGTYWKTEDFIVGEKAMYLDQPNPKFVQISNLEV